MTDQISVGKRFFQRGCLAGQIARVERCSRNTIRKIVTAEEFQGHLARVREKIWGGLDDAVDVVLENIRQNRDPKMAYELLRDAGLLPRATQIVHQPQQLTPSTPEEDGVDRQARMVASVLLEGHQNYGVELPERVKEKLARLDEEE